MNGFICVLKPPGMTSSDVVLRVRKRLPKGTKVGHAGTLDPEAAGILPIMIGKATRLFDYTTEKTKCYIVELKLGAETDTQDSHGELIRIQNFENTGYLCENDLKSFIGDIDQIPPMFSALKRDGQKLYELARKGEQIELEPRTVHIESIECVSKDEENGKYRLKVCCGKGTYMRTLCVDIGKVIGTAAHMGMLLRCNSGVFNLENAVTIESIENEDSIEKFLLPLDLPLQKMQRVDVFPRAERFVRNGNKLTRNEIQGEVSEGVSCRIYLKDQFAGIGILEENEMRITAMLLE